jgi:CspA family cold shock protein
MRACDLVFGTHVHMRTFRATLAPDGSVLWKETAMDTKTGTVTMVQQQQGYGWIRLDDGGGDVLAHFSQIQSDVFKSLKAGWRVEFEVKIGPKGEEAENIRIIEASALY